MCSIDQRSGGDQCHYFRKTDGYQRSEERAARKYSDYGFVLALICVALICLLYPTAASAWGYKGHRVVGSIADQMLHDNAKAQVSQILSYEDSPDQGVAITLRIAGPWADCVKSVVQIVDGQGHVTYSYEPSNPEFRIPCTSFEKDHQHPIEQARMEDYVGRNFSQCSYAPRGKEEGCHNTYHFDDVAFQRDRFDRSYLGTNEHDLVAAITAAIAMLKDNKGAGSVLHQGQEGSALHARPFCRRSRFHAPDRPRVGDRRRQPYQRPRPVFNECPKPVYKFSRGMGRESCSRPCACKMFYDVQTRSPRIHKPWHHCPFWQSTG
jgi:hypothetical protein